MLLAQLLGPDIMVPPEARRLFVTGLSADSRVVAPGFVFAALPGSRTDGASFLNEAVARGAVAVIAGRDTVVPSTLPVPVLRTENPRRELALMAARFYPRQPETAVAVTGTSGKTSVADFTRQIFSAAGFAAASVGTIGVVRPEGAVYGSLTTPDPVSLHQTLEELAETGVTHLAVEASSHGLDQYRLDGVRLTAAAFTNLGRDHLDYHPSVEHYLRAKLRLFEALLRPGQTAVVNTDGAMSETVADAARARGLRVLLVGRSGNPLRLESSERDGFRQRLRIRHPGGTRSIVLPLIGGYQVENALVAAGLAMASGIPTLTALDALETLKGVPGRLEIVGEHRGALVVVDYAHKPEALKAALDGVRPFVSGKLYCLFGCGGDRDRGKRPIMGGIAAEHADRVIVTDDNPRSEEPASIRTEILSGIPAGVQRRVKEIGDRRQAIDTSVAALKPGDVLVIAGKGHETGQIVGDKTLPFSDHEVAREAIARGGGQ
ncbi:MAG: UDP-N-acetylmuramoyl-L-alanyl-D-glutamate--2,6-diaminopimelate ligase [Hyphomicrobiaceae bacterium]